MKKLQCRHDRFPIFAAPPISDRFRELANSKNSCCLKPTPAVGLCSLRYRKSVYRLALEFVSNLFHLHDGTACHTCTHDIDKISTVLHAQLKTSCVPYGTYLRNTVPVFFHIHKVNQRAQHSGNLIIIYMCTWQAVTSCKWNKIKSNARETWCVILVSAS